MSAAQSKIGIWMASLETRHFSFDAFDASEDGARFRLKAGLAVHSMRCGGLEDDWYSEDDFNVRCVELDTAYIDGSPLTEGARS